MGQRKPFFPLDLFRLRFRIVTAALAGVFVIAVLYAAADLTLQVAALGVLVSVTLGVAWECLARLGETRSQTGILQIPLFLSHDSAVFERYRAISDSLLSISQNPDTIYRAVVLERLAKISDEIAVLAEGTIVYAGTETWRIVYEKLLRSPGLHLYRSAAWVKNRHYWQDAPGRQSTQINLELHDSGQLNIERTVILADEVWPDAHALPAEPIRTWIHEQHLHGIWIRMARQSVLVKEPDLLADIGIYGSRAVGTQELDDECRTVRFTLSFGFDDVARVEERWRRLGVYCVAYRDWLDQFSGGV